MVTSSASPAELRALSDQAIARVMDSRAPTAGGLPAGDDLHDSH